MFGASVAPLGPRTLARALEVRDMTARVLDEVKKQDNVSGADHDSRVGEVSLAAPAGSTLGVKIPGIDGYADEVLTAQVSIDPATSKVSKGKVECDYYLDRGPQYRGGGGVETFTVRPTTFKGAPATEYTYDRNAFRTMFGEYSREKIVVDARTGDVMSYKGKEFHQPFSQSLKEMVTTPSGIFLTVFAGLLGGAPMTLGGALFGPMAGVVAAGACVVGFAWAKSRPWSRSLPQGNS